MARLADPRIINFKRASGQLAFWAQPWGSPKKGSFLGAFEDWEASLEHPQTGHSQRGSGTNRFGARYHRPYIRVYALTTRTSQARFTMRGRRETRNDNPHFKPKPDKGFTLSRLGHARRGQWCEAGVKPEARTPQNRRPTHKTKV